MFIRKPVSLYLNEFPVTSFSKATMVMRFPAKKNVGCPNARRDFIPRKDGILHPPSSCHGAPLPLPQSLYGRTGSYADVITKISRINRLPDLFTLGAPRAPLSTAELILTTFLSFSDSYIGGLREARKPQNRTEKRKKKNYPGRQRLFLRRFRLRIRTSRGSLNISISSPEPTCIYSQWDRNATGSGIIKNRMLLLRLPLTEHMPDSLRNRACVMACLKNKKGAK